MHELSLCRHILRVVEGEAAGRRVTALRLRVGALAGVQTEALRFAFPLAAQGGLAEGARLEIQRVEGRGRCEGCGVEGPMSALVSFCGCGGVLRPVAGEELVVSGITVEEV